MADQLFKKRKAKRTTDLQRRHARRAALRRVLIVTEGEITEKNYFDALIEDLRLTNAEVQICGRECGSDPRSVVRYAIKTAKNDGDFDLAFCVFDRDSHETFKQALDQAEQSRLLPFKNNPNPVIVTWPCFEFWFLLHYCYTTQQFSPKEKKIALRFGH